MRRMTRPTVVHTRDEGGLANRLWPLAHLLAASRQAGLQFTSLVLHDLCNHFPDLESHAAEVGFLGATPIGIGRARSFAQRLLRSLVSRREAEEQVVAVSQLINSPRILETDALYIDSGQYVVEAHEFLTSAFRPKYDVIQAIASRVARLRAISPFLVGVHIRAGDYRTHAGGNMFFEDSEYADVMRSFGQQFSEDPIFIVCSNEVKEPADFPGFNVQIGGGGEIEDLYTLAACDFIIAPPSTYSQWASFYGRVPMYVHNRKFEELYGVSRGTIPYLHSLRPNSGSYGKMRLLSEMKSVF